MSVLIRNDKIKRDENKKNKIKRDENKKNKIKRDLWNNFVLMSLLNHRFFINFFIRSRIKERLNKTDLTVKGLFRPN